MSLNFSNISCARLSLHDLFTESWAHYKTAKYCFGVLYTLIVLCGLAGNGGMLVKIYKSKSYKLSSNLFLANLSLAEICFALTFSAFTNLHIIRKTWYWGSSLCKILPLSQIIAIIECSVRYRNIVTLTRRQLSRKTSLFLIGLSWGFAFLSGSLVIPHWRARVAEFEAANACTYFCSDMDWNPLHPKEYGTLLLSVQFFGPVMILCWCYRRILQKIHSDMLTAQMACRGLRAAAAARKRRVVRILVFMVAAFVVSWLPLLILALCKNYRLEEPYGVSPQFFLGVAVCEGFALSSVVWVPVVYFWLSSTHRRDMQEYFRRSILRCVARQESHQDQESIIPRISVAHVEALNAEPTAENDQSMMNLLDVTSPTISFHSAQMSLKRLEILLFDPFSDFDVSEFEEEELGIMRCKSAASAQRQAIQLQSFLPENDRNSI